MCAHKTIHAGKFAPSLQWEMADFGGTRPGKSKMAQKGPEKGAKMAVLGCEKYHPKMFQT